MYLMALRGRPRASEGKQRLTGAAYEAKKQSAKHKPKEQKQEDPEAFFPPMCTKPERCNVPRIGPLKPNVFQGKEKRRCRPKTVRSPIFIVA